MQSGAYKYKVDIYDKVKTQDKFGSETETYKLQRSTKAAINWKSGQRTDQYQVIVSDNIEIIVRDYCQINDDSQIIVENRKYKVTNYHEDLKYRDIVIGLELMQNQN